MEKIEISDTLNDITFEQGIKRLEEIVATLERGELSLEESIKRFKEGSALYQRLQEQLGAVEGEIKVLLENADGSVRMSEYPTE